MLTPGNLKLGARRIWGFALPSGTPASCPGLSPTCRAHCYAVAVERYRPAVRARYRRNLRASRRDFARRIVAFLIAHRVRVVRVHTGGDFYSARSAAGRWRPSARRSAPPRTASPAPGRSRATRAGAAGGPHPKRAGPRCR